MIITFANSNEKYPLTQSQSGGTGIGVGGDTGLGVGSGNGSGIGALGTARKAGMTRGTGASGAGVGVGSGAFFEKNKQNLPIDFEKKERTGLTADQLGLESNLIPDGVSMDYQIVMAHSMSPDDYAKAREDGFDYASMDPADIVTIQDKVKAEIAKGGTVISGYNDDLRDAILQQVPGGEMLANELQKAFLQADLPMQEESAEDIVMAWQTAQTLVTPNDGAISFLLENQLDPTIWNFALAQNSGAATMGQQPLQSGAPVLAEEPYMQKQIAQMLEENRMDPQQGMDDAQWLLNHQIPVTKENFQLLASCREVKFPVTPEQFSKAIANAYERGERAIQADLTRVDSIYGTACAAVEVWFSDEKMQELAGDLTARRQLEEVRLSMTAEVNVKLLRSGFSIDTAPMEELISKLKQAEEETAQSYFPKQEEPVQSYRLMEQTNRIVMQTKALPIDEIARVASQNTQSLEQYHENAQIRKDEYVKAGQQYEALMTAPRADLGDRISKAFANVDDLLKEQNLACTDENRRSVRILGYNRMEISAENIEKVSQADRMVCNLINRMKPAAVLQMIRDGVNPLTSSFDELNTYLDALNPQDETALQEREVSDYSKFLEALDRHNDITEQERDAYIGICRMLHQVSKLDGAAVGTVVNEQAQLQFSNLLSAVRSRRFGHMDVKIEDSFGTLSQQISLGRSITEQIMSGFEQGEEGRNEADEEMQRNMQLLRQAARVSAETVQRLEENQLTPTPDRLVTMEQLMQQGGDWYKELQKYVDRDDFARLMRNVTPERLQELGMQDDFPEDMHANLRGDMHANLQGEIYDNLRGENASLSSLSAFDKEYEQTLAQLELYTQQQAIEMNRAQDLSHLRDLNRRIHLAKEMVQTQNALSSQNRDYFLPVQMGDDMGQIHLRFAQGDADSIPTMDIRLDLPQQEGAAEAHFSMQDQVLYGYLTADSMPEVQNLKKTVDIFIESIQKDRGFAELQLTDFPVLFKENVQKQNNAQKKGMHSDVSKEARMRDTEGSERRTMLRLAGLLIQARQATSLEV